MLRLLAILTAIIVFAHPSACGAEVTLSLDSSVPAEGDSFTDAVLWVRVWEYDPKLADAGAKNVADEEVTECTHTKGTASMFTANIAVKKKEGMNYYVTSELFPNAEKRRGDRFYFADGFHSVFDGDGDDSQSIELRAIK